MGTTPNLSALEAELNEMIQGGQILEAFEKFYAENCVMQDQDMGPWEGKDTNREREKDFVSKITDFRDGSMVTGAVGDDVTFSIWNFDYTHEEWGDVKYQQVAVRHWENGKIVKERFYRG